MAKISETSSAAKAPETTGTRGGDTRPASAREGLDGRRVDPGAAGREDQQDYRGDRDERRAAEGAGAAHGDSL